MVKVSVVVPVYNQEKYIERCLDSILAQSLKDIEIILVDDGSTDSTPDILLRYKERDSRIEILHQQNLLAGAARNNGLQAAKGEYVVFWDSDDYFAEDALEVLYDEIRQEDSDICVGEAVKMDTHTGVVREGDFLIWKRIPEKRPFNKEDIPQYIFNFARNYPWNRMFKRSFLLENGLQFSNLKKSNDVFFVMKAFILADKITVVDNIIVYYQYRNADSLSGDAWKNKECVLKAHLEVKDFLIESGFWENQEIRQSFINNAFATLTTQLAIAEEREEYQKLYDFYKEEALPALGIENADIEKMYIEKNAYELTNLLSCDFEEFIFNQYTYYQKRTAVLREKLTQTRIKLSRANEKNLQLKEKKNEKIREQKERIELQREKIRSQQALLDRRLVRLVLKIQSFLGIGK